MTTIIAHGQEIIAPSPPHFIKPLAGSGTGLGAGYFDLEHKFGPFRILHVLASHRRHPKCFRASKQIGLFFLN